MSSAHDTLTLTGDIGPGRLDEIEVALTELLDKPRPQVEVRFVDVASAHLGVVNVLVKARTLARARYGDVKVVVDPNSQAQHLLSTVGIVGTMRP